MLSRLSENQIVEPFIRRSAKAKKSQIFSNSFCVFKKSELVLSYYMWLPFPLALAREQSMHICAYDAIYFREFIARVYRSNRKCAHICWNGTHDRAILDYRVPFCARMGFCSDLFQLTDSHSVPFQLLVKREVIARGKLDGDLSA